MTTPEQLFADLLAAEPSRPFVTYYDETSGERTELSVRSLANWVAKTHHLLATELGLGVGDTCFIALPAHWLCVPAVLGSLTAGLRLSTDAEGADVAFVVPGTVAAAARVPEVYALAPEHAAAGFGAEPPPGTHDYVSAVRPQADAWGGVHLTARDSDAFTQTMTRGEAVSAACERADRFGLHHAARVLVTRDWAGVEDWLDTLLAPLAVAGSVVYLRGCDDPNVLARRATQERCTQSIGEATRPGATG